MSRLTLLGLSAAALAILVSFALVPFGTPSRNPVAPVPPEMIKVPAESAPVGSHADALEQALGCTISGVVRGPTGKPIAGAVVCARPQNGGTAMTVRAGEDGTYAINSPAPGEYEVAVRHGRGFVGEAKRVMVRDGEPTLGVRLTLIAPGAVSGLLTDDASVPVAGAEVHAARIGVGSYAPPEVVFTGRAGRFHLRELPPGMYRVSALRGVFRAEEDGVRVSSGGTTRIELRLPAPGRVRVAVVDDAANPLGGVAVGVRVRPGPGRPDPRSTAPGTQSAASGMRSTDELGLCVFENLPPGELRIHTKLSGWVSDPAIVTVRPGRLSEVRVVMYRED